MTVLRYVRFTLEIEIFGICVVVAVVTLTPVTCDTCPRRGARSGEVAKAKVARQPSGIVDHRSIFNSHRETSSRSIRAVMPTTTSILQASLEQHNQTFETLLSLIPAKYYLVRDSDDNNDQVCLHCIAPEQTYETATGRI